MTSVLLMVDVQRNMLQPPSPVPASAQVGAVIEDVLRRAREGGARVVHIRNCGSGADDPDLPGTPGWELVHEVRPGEAVVDKRSPDAFDGTGLGELLPAPVELAVVGMQSEYCVRETALAALKRGHAVTLVTGAHATYDDARPAVELAREVEAELAAHGVAVRPPSALAFRPAAG